MGVYFVVHLGLLLVYLRFVELGKKCTIAIVDCYLCLRPFVGHIPGFI